MAQRTRPSISARALEISHAAVRSSELRGASREMEKSMTEQELKDMAHTKRKGKPEHKGD
ncbi:DUF3008 domain-containing protein [Paracoccus mutanolyticus]|uniref:DUF3008 domain-containing protein n=1 Tax=Paracoccus mutanolyticus TaxID=1499308 RepID=A0ABN5MBA6_9RHOB|nr:DUF3008 domain-containing protein [Paracoccus mutanolyticus]